MTRLLSLLCLILFNFGCVFKEKKTPQQGPLCKIKTYQVIPLFLSDETAAQEDLYEHIIAMLKTLGTVYITTECITDSLPSDAGMIITLNDFDKSKKGSIKIVAEAEVCANRYKTCGEIWNTLFSDPTLPYPVVEENGIAFRKDEMATCPDIKTIATQMVEEFVKQYQQDNPGSQPTFYFYSKIFSS